MSNDRLIWLYIGACIIVSICWGISLNSVDSQGSSIGLILFTGPALGLICALFGIENAGKKAYGWGIAAPLFVTLVGLGTQDQDGSLAATAQYSEAIPGMYGAGFALLFLTMLPSLLRICGSKALSGLSDSDSKEKEK